jgi:hypothetical protein
LSDALTDPFSALVASLKALASEPSDQLALFPESVGKAGDLAARFESSMRALGDDSGRQLSRAQLDALEALGARLATVSRDGAEFDADVWTDEAVRTSVDWRDVRALATAALDLFEIANADAVTHDAGRGA